MVTRVRTELGELEVEVAGDGPPALLWHSLCVDRKVWDRVRDELGTHRRLILLDAPGHGASSGLPGRFTLEACAEAALAVLAALGVDEPVDWVGNAWGGHVGIVVGARSPERLRTLTTIATLVEAAPGRLRREVHTLLAAHRLIGPRGVVASGTLASLLSPETRAGDAEAVAYVAGRIVGMDRAAFRASMRSIMLDRPSLAADVGRLRAPALFLTGAHDAICTPAQVRAAESDRVRAVVVDRAAHLTALEAPAPTTEAIIELWAASG